MNMNMVSDVLFSIVTLVSATTFFRLGAEESVQLISFD